MSFETGTATGKEDLMVKWFNFLQANGWTADFDYAVANQSPRYGVIQRKNQLSPYDENTVNLHCAFADADAVSGVAYMNMIPMRDYTSGSPITGGIEVGTSTGNYTAVSGAGHIQTNFPTSPFENYWFFESDYYAHAVVEWATGFFRHFGMGQLVKIGKYLGGEYYYGHFINQGASLIESALYNGHSQGLDPAINFSTIAPLVYGKLLNGDAFPVLQGLSSPEGGWHAFSDTGGSSGLVGTDADGRSRGCLAGMGWRSGPHHTMYMQGRSKFNGYRPMYPIFVSTWDETVTPDTFVPLGFQPDCRSISMEDGLLPGDEFTIGSDTWIVFPVTRRRVVKVLDDTEYSGLFGVAYKKVLT